LAIAVLTAGLVLGASVGVAAAQSADDAIRTLDTKDVAYEQDAIDNGVLNDSTLREVEQTTASVQDPNAYYKVVILGSPVESYPSIDAYAEAVLTGVGGDGRVMVYDTNTVGIASSVDPAAEVQDAEQAALQAGMTSYEASIVAAAQALGAPAAGGGSSGGGSGGGGGGGGSSGGSNSSGGFSPVFLLILLVIGMGVVMLFVLANSRKSKRGKMPGPLDAEAANRVRTEVDAASNLVIALADCVDLPDAPADAKEAFQEGASAYADLQDELEEADTRPELEHVWPRLVHARWKLECARSILDGAPPPQEPTPEPLFPREVMPVPKDAPNAPPVALAPSAGYKHMDSSPWMTQAAIMAASILLSRGMGGGRVQHRQPVSNPGDLWGGIGGSMGRRGGGGVLGPVFGRGSSGNMGRRRG